MLFLSRGFTAILFICLITVASQSHAKRYYSTTAPLVTLLPNALIYSSQLVGTMSAVQYVKVTNSGGATLTFNGNFVLSGPFVFGGLGNCGTSLAPGASCNISIKFAPTATGTLYGKLTIYDNAGNSPQYASLSGTGVTSLASPTPAPVSSPVASSSPSPTPKPSPSPTPVPLSSATPVPSPSPIVSTTSFTYYVSVAGNDLNSGSQASPWRTIQHAANVVGAGSTVFVEDGTYNETVAITRGGTSAAPVIFRSLHKWGAKIAPTSTSGNANYTLYIAGASYVTVQDFEITATTTTDSAVKMFVGAPNNQIIGNDIHDVGVSTTTCTSGAGILIADNNETIRGNRIHRIGPPRSTSFRCNQQHGIYVTSGSGGRLQDNLIFEVWQGLAFHLTGIGLSSWTVTNNTVFNVGDSLHADGGAFILDCLGGTCDYNVVNNNIFYQTQNTTIYEWNDGGIVGSHNTYSNNLINSAASNILVTGRPVYTVTSAPQFMNYTGDQAGDYQLMSTSPAVNNGTPQGAPAVDFDGFGRPYGAAIDIGAYEWH